MAEAGLPARVDVLVIGAGVSGLAMAHRLNRAGVNDYIVLDKSGGAGGVWRDNRYPGAGCDVPSHLYSFSFAPKPDWSRKFAGHDEIRRYFEGVAARLGLNDRLDNAQADRLEFDEAAGRWTVTLADGRSLSARIVISAVGQLNDPHTPAIEGLDRFSGPVMHTARWDEQVDLAGKRVGVIGSAASAIQMVPPTAKIAARLEVFQRTPNWVIPKPDRAFLGIEKWAFRHIPGWRRLYRLGSFLIHEARYAAFRQNSLASAFTRWRLSARLKAAVKDEALRTRLTPDYAPGCKRILLSNDWFDTLQRDNVSLHDGGVKLIEANAVITGSDERVPVDALVLATGFRATEFLSTLDVTGREGRDLKTVWGASPSAYKGVAVPGFPNLFILYGPNTNLGHNSIIYMTEQQAGFVARQVERILHEDLRALEVEASAFEAWNAKLQRDLSGTVWAGDCPSWYKTEDGVITNNWSGLASGFARALRGQDRSAFIASSRAETH
ncbi:MAG: NAD(P)/FAD-dependent oxidoreductase [Pseudomonadota bacterium]